jgi:hypothetical protein
LVLAGALKLGTINVDNNIIIYDAARDQLREIPVCPSTQYLIDQRLKKMSHIGKFGRAGYFGFCNGCFFINFSNDNLKI